MPATTYRCAVCSRTYTTPLPLREAPVCSGADRKHNPRVMKAATDDHPP